MRCAVYGCNVDTKCKSFTPGIKFFRFPNNGQMRSVWKQLCKRADDFNLSTARICSNHFTEEDYVRNLKHELLGYTPKNYRALKEEAVPSLNLPTTCKQMQDSGREKRQEKRQQKKLVEGILKEADISNNCVNGDGLFSGDGPSTSSSIPLGESSRSIGVNTETEIDERDKIIANLQKKIQFLEHRQDLIGKLFIEEQLKKLEGAKTRLRWSVEDISKSIVIYSAGPRAYGLLLKKGYPFLAVSCLRSWMKRIKIAPGILKNVFKFMKLSEMGALDKVCVISFDEMKIKKAYLYDKSNDETLKPYNYAQVVMLRGLFKNWKQSVFYDFDFKLSKEKLFEIIQFAESSGFQVVAMVSDLGAGNRALYNELNVNQTNIWFKNPVKDQKVFVFADVPHLNKLIRNHFVDHGFIIQGKEINKSIIEELLDVTSTSDLKITHKISKENLNVQGAARQKVLATKLFSHTISMAITRCGSMGALKQENWIDCAEFFKLVNDWFDVMNVRGYSSDSRGRTKAYGLALDLQNSIIDKMTNTTENLRVKGKQGLLPFQKGIIMSNTSLKLLLEDLKARFSIEYLLTYRLNQDVLENFFGTIRAKEGLHDHPNALEFKYRLRSYILGRHEGSLSSAGNVEEDNAPDIITDDVNLCAKYFSSFKENIDDVESQNEVNENELTEMEYDGLENLAGYICHKLKKPDSVGGSHSNEYTWVTHLSEGGLSKPSPEFMTDMEKLEKIFKSVNSDNLYMCKNYLKKLMDMSSSVLCDEKAKILFFRSRIYFPMRQLNRELHNSTISRKRKMSKIVN